MNKKLDNYFEKAKLLYDKEHPYSNEELIEIISTPRKINLKLINGIIIMSVFIVISLLIFNSLAGIHTGSSVDKPDLKQTGRKSISQQANKDVNIIEKDNVNDSTTIRYQQKPKIIASKSLITYVNDLKEISRPFKVSREENKKSKVAKATRESIIDEVMTEAGNFRSDIKGEPVSGLVVLELSKEELKKIGINYTNDTLSFITEEIDRIHPVTFKHDLAYHYSDYIYPKFKLGYPANGDSFILKKRYTIALNYKYNPVIDTMCFTKDKPRVKGGNWGMKPRHNTKVVDGQEIKFTEFVYTESSDSRLIGKNSTEVQILLDKAKIGYHHEIIPYTGWTKDSFTGLSPVAYGFKYNEIDNEVKELVYDNPLMGNNNLRFSRDYTEMLPIIINFGKNKLIAKIVFWYVPTEEFISNLPDRYRFSLQSEYKTIQKIKMGELNPHDACEKIKDESLLDVCRIVSGALTIESIYPNPASDNNTTITINLSESRKIRADIHDLKGNYIGNIMNERYLSEGTHKIDIDFENKLVQGIYLVAVRSDKGEIATIKLIIN